MMKLLIIVVLLVISFPAS
ncbi:type I toxin-antitoxin system Ibs family toxin [Shigella boydii]|nr:type I toxin-antitoxin system Ibs family toxin [Shigella boydii]